MGGEQGRSQRRRARQSSRAAAARGCGATRDWAADLAGPTPVLLHTLSPHGQSRASRFGAVRVASAFERCGWRPLCSLKHPGAAGLRRTAQTGGQASSEQKTQIAADADACITPRGPAVPPSRARTATTRKATTWTRTPEARFSPCFSTSPHAARHHQPPARDMRLADRDSRLRIFLPCSRTHPYPAAPEVCRNNLAKTARCSYGE